MENREVFHQSVLQINRQINFREKTTFGIQFNPDTGPKPAGAKRPVFEQPDGIGVERPVRGEQGHKPGRCLKIYGVIAFMLATGFAILGTIVSRIKIAQAIKLGED